jgi:acyl carrier protein phosphodiesterase
MNLLAHAHLSGNNNDILLGNFIADAVKGKKKLNYKTEIQQGFALHREIDEFTDNHFLVHRSIARVKPYFSRFSGVVMDIYYDHFLARNWHDYDQRELPVFAAHVYGILTRNVFILPHRTKRLLPFLISQNWLTAYGDFTGLKHVFNGMDRKTGRISGMNNAIDVLKQNYDDLYADFRSFYPELMEYADKQLKLIIEEVNNIK